MLSIIMATMFFVIIFNSFLSESNSAHKRRNEAAKKGWVTYTDTMGRERDTITGKIWNASDEWYLRVRDIYKSRYMNYVEPRKKRNIKYKGFKEWYDSIYPDFLWESECAKMKMTPSETIKFMEDQ